MKVAVIGSRCLKLNDLGRFLPDNITEIISGGARGIDQCAKLYAMEHNIPITEFLPDYSKYGKTAPLKRNMEIIKNADLVLAFWDGKSGGTKYVINNCKKMNVSIKVYVVKK